jgi:O-antigen/teichoic acid export membrane protein
MNSFLQTLRAIAEKGFFSLLIANFLTQFLGFGTTLLVTRILTIDQLANARILQSYTLFFIVLASFGYNISVLKYCSESIDLTQKCRLLSAAVRRSLASTGIVTLALTGLALSGYMTTSAGLNRWLIVYSAIVPLAVLSQLLMGFLQALKKIKELSRVQSWIKLQSFAVIVLSTWFWSFPGFVFATVAAYLAALIPLLVHVPWRLVLARGSAVPKGFDKMAMFSLLGIGMVTLEDAGQFFLLDHFFGDRAALGYYALATIFVLGARQITATVQMIATPYFSERSSDGPWFRKVLVRTQTRLAALSLAVAAAVYVAGSLLIHTFYGPSYLPTMTYLSILLVKYVLWSCVAVVGVALLGLGKVHLNLAVATVTTAVSLTASWLCLDRYGLVGVAWAQVAAAATSLVLSLAICRRALDNSFGKLERGGLQPAPALSFARPVSMREPAESCQ